MTFATPPPAAQADLPLIWLSNALDPASPQMPEFYSREYGLYPIDPPGNAKGASQARATLAHAFEPRDLEVLASLSTNNVRLILSSDETYSPRMTRAILATPAVAEVLRNYPFHPFRMSPIYQTAAAVIREPNLYKNRRVLPALKAWGAGYVIAARSTRSSRRLQHNGVRTTALPLGYTDLFVRGLRLLAQSGKIPHLPQTGSLVAFLATIQDDILALKRDRFAFVGQRGKFQRASALAAAADLGISLGPIRDAYGAGNLDRDTAAIEYVGSLLESRFALCPPGNYSGDSFRLTEASLLSCVPLEVFPIISDPLRPRGFWMNDQSIVADSWRLSLRHSMALSASAAEPIAKGAFAALAGHIAVARDLIRR